VTTSVDCFKLPFFSQLEPAGHVLVAGAGGGFDVFSGLPLYFALRAAGKQVSLANLSFSNLPPGTAGRHLTPVLVQVTADSEGSKSYFPEKHLSQWFRDRGEEVPVYCIHRTGPKAVIDAYRVLADELRFDTLVLMDGGTDSLMRGDEAGLGTPLEDMASIAAADLLDPTTVPRRFLVCLGFGIDAFHGVCHAHVLEAVADLIQSGGYLGTFSLLDQMPEVRQFCDATEYVLARTPDRQSIVLTSILSALEGRFGNHQRTDRTADSELFINPLMAFYWCFQLEQVARRVLYLDGVADIEGYVEFQGHIATFQRKCGPLRAWKDLPM
jgi:hypothetical protein